MTMTTEQEREAAAPHEYGCFEEAAEEIQAEALAKGIRTEGNGGDDIGGLTIMDRFHQDMVAGTRPCRCTETARDRAIAELIRRHADEFQALLSA